MHNQFTLFERDITMPFRLSEPLQRAVTQVAIDAGKSILHIYEAYAIESNAAAIQHKKDDSPLTQADLAAHHVIVDCLKKLTPDIPVVSEEDEASLVFRVGKGTFWLIDPLDGTKEFIARNGEFTVNIALVNNGIAEWGVVHAPVLNTTYVGGAAYGAIKYCHGEQSLLQVADTPQGTWRVVASKSHLNQETQDFIDRLGESVETVQAGSSLKFCKIAEGSADVYPRLAPTCEWDTAAAQAVVEGAGGLVCDLQQQPLRYGKAELLNPSFVASAQALVI